MAIINQILGAIETAASQTQGAAGTTPSPIASVVQQMLGADPAQGLNGLVQKFEAAGLANVIQSWISSGANLPISVDQLHQALGAEHLNQLAQSAGIDKTQLLAQLSAALPGVVDGLTPGGQVPAGGIMQTILSQLTGAKPSA